MNAQQLATFAAKKANFNTLQDYLDFCVRYLDFVAGGGVHGTILSQNDTDYHFLQYKDDGCRHVTRPLRVSMMYDAERGDIIRTDFINAIDAAKNLPPGDPRRTVITNSIYTIQQSIGAAMDALATSQGARKVNGDLFERLILLLIKRLGIPCRSGTVRVPVKVEGEKLFHMNYQHDLVLEDPSLAGTDAPPLTIGSVKTSSKDRVDKIFVDKFMYSRLTGTEVPHFGVFLNDVQRKKTKSENEYGVSSTFLTGKFKGYTAKLNPLDGVFYCDLRPHMATDPILSREISEIDRLFCESIWAMTGRE